MRPDLVSGINEHSDEAMNRTTSAASSRWALLAEDSESYRRLIRLHLVGFGYRVEEVSDGREAVDAFAPGRHQLLVADMSMPRLDGPEAVRMIRERQQGASLRVVMLTGHDSDSDRRVCLDAGADALLVKPVNRQDLLDAVRGDAPPPEVDEAPPPMVEHTLLNEARLKQLGEDTSPELLPKLVARILRESQDHVRSARDLAQRGEAAQCGRAAHALKTCAATIGADLLSQAARQLESACRRNSPAEILVFAMELDRLMQDTQKMFEDKIIGQRG
jgi:two-component system sensor histidine kinase/response regulator